MMRRMNIIFILLSILLITTRSYSQTCSGFPAVPAIVPCASASSSLSSGANINGGGSYSYCSTSSQSFSGINLSGGTILICGNATISSGTFNSGKIFVACGATLTFSNNVTFSGNLGIINYGTVQFNGSLTFQNGGCYLYNENSSSRVTIAGSMNFPANQVDGYIRNTGKITINGTLNLGGGGKICAGAGSIISTGNFTYGGGNCNPSDGPSNNLLFTGNSSQQTILRYTGTASVKGVVTASSSWKIYRSGSAPTFPCSGITSSWGLAVVNTSPPALPAEPSQSSCLVNGSVSCNSVIVLPVELLYFKVNCADNKSKLEWATASERNNESWTIERSTDLVNIEKIGTLPGAGNSSQVLKYDFEDEGALGQLAYYRITQHDYDGKSESFDWTSIDCGLSGEYNIFPNPSSGTFRITTSKSLSATSSYQVSDFNGKIVFEADGELTSGKPLDIDLADFRAGMYFLKIESGSESWTTKLVKQ